MLLHNICLEGWRKFSEPKRVGPFSPGLNIVHGPNGSGKSTLMLALARAMFDGHHTSGQDVESLRPWGKELSPALMLDFEHAGESYRLEKGFLGRKGTILSKQSDRAATLRLPNDSVSSESYERFMEGRNADDYVRNLLAGDESKRGASKSQHWGLAQVLWVSQGELKLQALEGNAQDLVQQALSAQLATPESSEVEERIRDIYSRIYTPTGKLKSGASAAPVELLRNKTLVASTQVGALRQRLVAFENASRRIEELRCLAEQAQTRENGVTERLTNTRSKSQEYLQVSSQCQSLRHEVGAAKAKAEAAQTQLTQIAASRREVGDDEAKLARLQTAHPSLETKASACFAREEAARTHAQSVRSKRPEIDIARSAARDAQAMADAQRRANAVSVQIATVEETSQQLAKVQAERNSIHAPTSQQLKALRQTEQLVRESKLRLEGALVTLTFEAEERIEVRTLAGEAEGNNLVEVGERFVLRGAPETALYLPGVGTIRATGPVNSAESLRAALATAEEHHHRLASEFELASLETLEELQTVAQRLDGQIAQLQTRLNATLAGKTLEQLRFELKLAEQTRTEVIGRHAEWSTSPPQPLTLHGEAEQLEKNFLAEIDDAEAKVDEARSERDRADHQVSLSKQEIENTQGHFELARKRLAALLADGRDDARRQADCDQLLLDYGVARAKLAQAEPELARFARDPLQEIAALEIEVNTLRQEVARTRQSLHREEALLEGMAGEAPYSALATAEEELAELETSLAREQIMADAIKLLHRTLEEVKRETVRSVIDPVRIRAQETLQRIAGQKFEGISFGEQLLPEGVHPQQALGESIPLEQLSGGEKEQVYFAVRMALAELVFTNQRELVVLDDVFVNSDATRIGRIVSLLEEAAERFQIVLLTCHPERYRHCSQARFFDLSATESEIAASELQVADWKESEAKPLSAPPPVVSPAPPPKVPLPEPVAERSAVPAKTKAKSFRARNFWESDTVEK